MLEGPPTGGYHGQLQNIEFLTIRLLELCGSYNLPRYLILAATSTMLQRAQAPSMEICALHRLLFRLMKPLKARKSILPYN